MTYRHSLMWYSLPHMNGTQLSLTTGLTLNFFQTLPSFFISLFGTLKVFIQSSVHSATSTSTNTLPPIRFWLHCMGRDKRLNSPPTLLYMMPPHLMKILASWSVSILMTSWGEPFFFLFERMHSQTCIVEHVNHLEDFQVP